MFPTLLASVATGQIHNQRLANGRVRKAVAAVFAMSRSPPNQPRAVDHGREFTNSSRYSLAKFFVDCSLMPRSINRADGPT